MPGFILHAGATVICSHGGQSTPLITNPRVLVSGQPIVMQPSIYTVAGCPFTTPAGNPLPCITAQWVSAATRITSNGMPVLLMDSQSISTPNGTPLTIVTTQTRVSGI